MQPDVAAEGDSSINTKKGFLISLPSKKKKSAEPGSGIVMAKTVNHDNAGEKNGKAPKESKDVKNAKGTGSAKESREPHEVREAKEASSGNRRERGNKNGRGGAVSGKNSGTEPHENDAKRPNGANTQNQPHSQKQQNPPKKNRGARTQNPGQAPNPNPSQNGEHRENAPKEAKEQKNPAPGNTPNAQRPSRPEKGREAPKNNNAGRGKPNAASADAASKNAARKKNGSGRNDRRKEPRMPSLSPLSGDMMSFGKSNGSGSAPFAEKSVGKEPSLEEKYKNAVPLAEQIAAEEERRRVKPRAYRTETLDRTLAKDGPHAVRRKKANNAVEADENVLSEETENTPETAAAKQHDLEIVGIRFREAGKIYYFDPDGQEISYGTPVIVETTRGCEYGYTAIANRLVPYDHVISPLKKIKRVATPADTEKYQANKTLEAEAGAVFKKKVKQLGLEMNLVFVEYTFDNSKLLFYFTAETRIDFRELVKELASIFRTRIELRQIGVRDEAKLLGGLGTCGRCVCCNSFLGDFAQVSIKMAKEQGLSLNSAKISGACGKLMCCLRFEDKVYSEEMARTPKVGAVVETPQGRGVVAEANALKGEVKVTLESTPDAPPKPFSRDDVTVVGFNKSAVPNEEAAAEDNEELSSLND